ncbi:hypothetical protein [Texcoconibacillus texcoconensis]|uniref:Uncharacterized protein n=1 Tax=Texcoconibacillus texcoconensis TaxID=1095777 RepID=A0A840QLZ4_9BACI|nr:hypothetical protein [Texcoconibacillus texcoconensis]MBB5172361.1 hypothetical protein [Texcoconibacillus texcoconensis]
MSEIEEISFPEPSFQVFEFVRFSFGAQLSMAVLFLVLFMSAVFMIFLSLRSPSMRRKALLLAVPFLIVSSFPFTALMQGYMGFVDVQHAEDVQNMRENWLEAEVLPVLKDQDRKQYEVMNTTYVNPWINENGLYWIDDNSKTNDLCIHGAVLELESEDGERFNATGPLEIVSSEDAEGSFLTAYYIENGIDEILHEGLYQGKLTVPSSIFENLRLDDC